jgi:hypothetical protein
MIDLSGNWHDRLSRQTATALVKRCLAHGWIDTFRRRRGRAAALMLKQVSNRSSEHLNTGYFTEQLRAQLARSQRVRVRLDARRADFVVTAEVAANNDATAGRELRHYAITMSVTNLASGEIVWIGVHQVKRLIERAVSANRGPSTKVTELKPSDRVNLSGRFSGSDLEAVARRMATRLERALARRPGPRLLVRAYPLKNRSSQFISLALLTHLLQARTLGQVRWLEPAERRPRTSSGARLAADAVLSGELTTTSDGADQRYTVRLRLADPQRGKELWSAVEQVTRRAR